MASHINENNVKQFIAKIENTFFYIPFKESQFEIERFFINPQLTPERAFRAIGVRMLEVIVTLRTAQFETLRLGVDIDELAEVVANRDTPPFTKRRAEIDIEEKTFKLDRLNKVINDALLELNFLYTHFERLPEFTREEFEAAEPVFHNERVNREFLKGTDISREAQNLRNRNPALEKRRNGAPSGNNP